MSPNSIKAGRYGYAGPPLTTGTGIDRKSRPETVSRKTINVLAKSLSSSSSSSPIVSGGYDNAASAALPWQASLIYRLFSKDYDPVYNRGKGNGKSTTSSSLTSSDTRSISPQANRFRFPLSFDLKSIPFINSRLAKAAMRYVSTLYSKLVTLSGGGAMLAKALSLTVVALVVVTRISQWYTRIGDMEIILDNTDFSYKSFGGHQNGVGVSYLATLNYTAIEAYGYTELFNRLETAIQIPRFPHTLREYSMTIGREVADIVSAVEKHMRIR